MTVLTASVGRGGSNKSADVFTVQSLLNQYVSNLGIARLATDSQVGSKTIGAIEEFQRRIVGLARPDGRVDPNGATLRALDGGRSTHTTPQQPSPSQPVSGAVSSTAWPSKPSFSPLLSNDDRVRIFGRFQYVHAPVSGNAERIQVVDDWVKKNIVSVQLDMGPNLGVKSVQFHRLAAAQLQRLWKAWGDAGLLDRVLTYGGSYAARFIRGSTKNLSNHSFGSAFDMNVAWNGLGNTPALVGKKGSVRELVPLANEHGFYWGGHFSRLDGMHFEVARLK